MSKNGIDIVCARETHISQNCKERKRDYTWYLNGYAEGEREFAGMAVIIRNGQICEGYHTALEQNCGSEAG